MANNSTFDLSISTLASIEVKTSMPTWIGYIALVIAAIFLGSNWVPIKKVKSGDGVFYLWMTSNGIFLSGILILLYTCYSNAQDSIPGATAPALYPIVMIGGASFMIGCMPIPLIVRCIGLGLGLLLWSITKMLSGWAADRFGLFGTKAQIPRNELFNYLAVAIAIVRAIIYGFVKATNKPHVKPEKPIEMKTVSKQENTELKYADGDDEKPEEEEFVELAVPSAVENPHHKKDTPTESESKDWLDRLTPMKRHMLGVVLALLCGVLYGVPFIPVQYLQHNVQGVSRRWLDFCFSQYLGVWLTGMLYMLIYSIYKRSLPDLYPRVLLPGFLCGILWAVAQTAFFIANDALSPVVTFPIMSTLPGVFAALWSIFVFKEIVGLRNYLLIVIGAVITAVGAILGALSK